MRKIWDAIVTFFVDLFDMGDRSSRPAIPKSGPRLLSVTAEANNFISWKAEGIDHWKNNADRLSAYIVINGVEAEYIREGYTRQHINNVYGGGGHGVRGLKKGKPCEVKLRKLDRKEETNPITFIWAFKDS